MLLHSRFTSVSTASCETNTLSFSFALLRLSNLSALLVERPLETHFSFRITWWRRMKKMQNRPIPVCDLCLFLRVRNDFLFFAQKISSSFLYLHTIDEITRENLFSKIQSVCSELTLMYHNLIECQTLSLVLRHKNCSTQTLLIFKLENERKLQA